MTGFGFGANGRQTTTWGNKAGGWGNTTQKVNGIELRNVPTDTVSCLEFEERDRPLLAAGSWDGTVRIWEFDTAYRISKEYDMWSGEAQNRQAILKLAFSEGPLYFVTTDGRVWSWDITKKGVPASQILQVLGHVTGLKYLTGIHSSYGDGQNGSRPGLLYCTANAFGPSAVAIIDIGAKNILPICEVPCKFVDMTVSGGYAYFATVGGPVFRLDLANGSKTLQECNVSIQEPIGAVTCMTALAGSRPGFMVGSIFGDVIMARAPVSGTMTGASSFELLLNDRVAQMDTQTVTACWAINCVARSSHAPIVIAGATKPYSGNGKIWLWDLDKEVASEDDIGVSFPVTACAVSPYGNVYAFAIGYDWQFGVENPARYNPKIMIREVHFPESK